jgi:BirA family transcriptional regulator, biotin operon repressor / biotin---[acetyl-CoA-carboxylase] ligase
LNSNPFKLPPEFADALTQARPSLGLLASEVLFYTSVGSTNDIAASLAIAREDCEGAVVLADSQTAGRGRRGHTCVSPEASGLYVSVVLMPARTTGSRERAFSLLTLAAGVALSEAVQQTTGLTAHIKWPNDLFVERRKLAGILAEAVDGRPETRNVVLGYGINVGRMSYPPELSTRATSLETELGRPIDRADLLAASLVALSRRYDDLLAGRFDAILQAWRLRAPWSTGARVEWDAHGGRCAGVTAGIDDMGALLVQAGHRTERIVAGEVTWLQM